MKQIADLIPVILFFITYKMKGSTLSLGGFSYELDGIFSATWVLIISSGVQIILTWLITKHVEKRLLYMFLAIAVFGGATLTFRDEIFIQWKPTIFNWGMALAFLTSQFIGEKNLIERALGSQIELPEYVWRRLNYTWIINFVIVGALNLFVAYNFSEDTWVSYKMYSAIGFTLLLAVVTALIIAPHLKEDENSH
jgi:intracellular septation protein